MTTSYHSYASHTSPEYLLSWANSQITALEESLEHIAHTKTQLRDHAHEVKTQIHGAISRQLETLRNREVWLLSQVEVIKQAKDDMLFQQQEEISRALGALKNALDCLESTINSDDSNVEQVLAETLDRLKKLNLHPCETPHITFKANSPAMKNAIFKFGKVDSKGLPIENAFADPRIPSSSLPRCFEEYDDAEHHVLYKTLESVCREKNSDAKIQVRIPKLSEDGWLYKPTGSSCPSPPPSTPAKATTKEATPLAAWLLKFNSSKEPEATTDASIRHWLHHIQDGEMEDDFEFLEHHKTRSSSESDSIEIVPMSIEENTPAFSYFLSVQSSPSTTWLLQSHGSVHVHENANEKAKPLASQLSYFRDLSNNMDDWLVNKSDGINTTNPRSADFCYTQCACLPTDLEIEDLEGITCLPSPKSQNVASDLRVWLKRERKPEDDLEGPNLAKVCRANETCASVGECCCEPNCMDLNKSSSNKWLFYDKNNRIQRSGSAASDSSDSSAHHSKNTNVIIETYEKIRKTPASDWLKSTAKEDMENSEVQPFVKYMKSLASSEWADWLQKSQKLPESGPICCDSFTEEQPVLDQWLIKKLQSCSVSEDGNKSQYGAWLKRSMTSEDVSEKQAEKVIAMLDDWCVGKEWLRNAGSDNVKRESGTLSCGDCDISQWIISKNMEA